MAGGTGATGARAAACWLTGSGAAADAEGAAGGMPRVPVCKAPVGFSALMMESADGLPCASAGRLPRAIRAAKAMGYARIARSPEIGSAIYHGIATNDRTVPLPGPRIMSRLVYVRCKFCQYLRTFPADGTLPALSCLPPAYQPAVSPHRQTFLQHRDQHAAPPGIVVLRHLA